MTASATGFRRRFDLVRHLVGREFRLRYRRSVLGWTWAVVLPLARLLVLSFVFTQVIPLDIPNYAVFLYTGLLAWLLFSAGVSSATTSVVDRSDLLLRPGVPRAALPLTAVMGDLIDYLVAFPILLAWVWFDIGLSLSLVGLVPLLAAQLMLMLGIGYLLAPLHVVARDVAKVIDVALLLGFYMTPVFYSPDDLPDDLQWVADVNPVAHLIASQRSVLIDGRWPALVDTAGLLMIGLAVLALGLAVYRRFSGVLVDQL